MQSSNFNAEAFCNVLRRIEHVRLESLRFAEQRLPHWGFNLIGIISVWINQPLRVSRFCIGTYREGIVKV